MGFTRDSTNYTDVLRRCNKYHQDTQYAKLAAIGYVRGVAPKYIKDFRVYFASPTTNPNYVQFQGTSVT